MNLSLTFLIVSHCSHYVRPVSVQPVLSFLPVYTESIPAIYTAGQHRVLLLLACGRCTTGEGGLGLIVVACQKGA